MKHKLEMKHVKCLGFLSTDVINLNWKLLFWYLDKRIINYVKLLKLKLFKII